jgi:hypothetical protein
MTKSIFSTYKKLYDFFTHPADYKILQKGRQVGATQAAAGYILSQMLSFKYFSALWLDVNISQINVYKDKYFKPMLAKIPTKWYHFDNVNNRICLNNCGKSGTFKNAFINFRSFNTPSSIEGDNHSFIIVNECGFILETNYVLEEILSPMVWATRGKMIFIGTPKRSTSSFHYRLIKEIEEGKRPDWHLCKLSSYDNPFLDHERIRQAEKNMSKNKALSQIYGEFVKSETEISVEIVAIEQPMLPTHLVIEADTQLIIILFVNISNNNVHVLESKKIPLATLSADASAVSQYVSANLKLIMSENAYKICNIKSRHIYLCDKNISNNETIQRMHLLSSKIFCSEDLIADLKESLNDISEDDIKNNIFAKGIKILYNAL